MKYAIAGIALALGLTGCGIEGVNNTNTWLEGPIPNTKVFCVGNDSGGLDCDWVGYDTKNRGK